VAPPALPAASVQPVESARDSHGGSDENRRLHFLNSLAKLFLHNTILYANQEQKKT